MDFTVENAGTTIACREYAGPDVPSDAPALVCVHGACVDGIFFDGIARELSLRLPRNCLRPPRLR